MQESEKKEALHLHLFILADTFIQSDLQLRNTISDTL